MDKFRVGQKVRIIRVTNYPSLLGEVCFITEPKQTRTNFKGHKWEGYGVDLPLQTRENKLRKIYPQEDALEPIYDGDEKSSWEECLWKPVKDNVPLSTQ